MKKFWSIIRKIFITLFILQLVYIFYCKWFNPPITITQIVSWIEGNGFDRENIDYSRMGSNIKLAVISSEDQLFATNNGFEMNAIEKAEKYNDVHKKKRRGASTISQQTAKNVFLWQGGGYFRKALEVYFTFMIEKIWGKKRILEVYLNVAEMGKGTFGVQIAAKKYFGKDAFNLSRAEAAMIAAALPNPKAYTIKPLSNYVRNRYDDIEHQMDLIEGFPENKSLINK